MKSLHDLVYEKLVISNQRVNEKLVINKDIVSKKIEIPDIDNDVKHRIEDLMYEKSPSALYKHMAKMEGYMKKGSKPKILVNTIKDLTKLINRWYCAIQLEWDEAIQVFGDAITDRTDITLDNLHQYILYQYKNAYKNNAEHFKNYLDLYNIKYNQ